MYDVDRFNFDSRFFGFSFAISGSVFDWLCTLVDTPRTLVPGLRNFANEWVGLQSILFDQNEVSDEEWRQAWRQVHAIPEQFWYSFTSPLLRAGANAFNVQCVNRQRAHVDGIPYQFDNGPWPPVVWAFHIPGRGCVQIGPRALWMP